MASPQRALGPDKHGFTPSLTLSQLLDPTSLSLSSLLCDGGNTIHPARFLGHQGAQDGTDVKMQWFLFVFRVVIPTLLEQVDCNFSLSFLPALELFGSYF